MPILSQLTINKHTVEDSFVFAEEVTKTGRNYVMASLDAQSFFTGIPLEEAIENCLNDLFYDISKIDNQAKQDLYDLLSAAPKGSPFLLLTTIFIVK